MTLDDLKYYWLAQDLERRQAPSRTRADSVPGASAASAPGLTVSRADSVLSAGAPLPYRRAFGARTEYAAATA